MDGLAPSFAANEYIERWLADLQPNLSAEMQANVAHPGQSKGERKSNHCNDNSDLEASSPRKRIKTTKTDPTKEPLKRVRSPKQRSENGNEDDSNGSMRSVIRDRISHSQRRSLISPRSPQTRNCTVDESSKKHERQLRHKTKEDKYEYKGGIVGKWPGYRFDQKARRRHRTKTGEILNREFKPPNVESERLTLTRCSGLGIFGKGKASALLQTRGLPDLTFSEMTFLTQTRQPKSILLEKPNSTRSSKKKERSKQVSEIFATPSHETTIIRSTSSAVKNQQRSIEIAEPGTSPALLSPAKPVQTKKSTVTPTYVDSRQGQDVNSKRIKLADQVDVTNEGDDIEHIGLLDRVTDETSDKVVPQPTMYCSWPTTPLNPGIEPTSVDLQDVEKRNAAAHFVATSSLTTNPDESVTNSSLDRYTRQLLLVRHQNRPDVDDDVMRGRAVVSLDDLKGMAQRAEIEKMYSQLPDMVDRCEQSPNAEFMPWLQSKPFDQTATALMRPDKGSEPCLDCETDLAFPYMTTNSPSDQRLQFYRNLQSGDQHSYTISPCSENLIYTRARGNAQYSRAWSPAWTSTNPLVEKYAQVPESYNKLCGYHEIGDFHHYHQTHEDKELPQMEQGLPCGCSNHILFNEASTAHYLQTGTRENATAVQPCTDDFPSLIEPVSEPEGFQCNWVADDGLENHDQPPTIQHAYAGRGYGQINEELVGSCYLTRRCDVVKTEGWVNPTFGIGIEELVEEEFRGLSRPQILY